MRVVYFAFFSTSYMRLQDDDLWLYYNDMSGEWSAAINIYIYVYILLYIYIICYVSASSACEKVVEQVAEVHMCMPMCPNRSQGRSRETSRRILQTKQGFVQHVICLQAGTTRTIMHVYMSKVCVSIYIYTYIYIQCILGVSDKSGP